MAVVDDTPGPAATAKRFDLPRALKDAGMAGLVALGLTVIMVGVRTVDQPGGLGLETPLELGRLRHRRRRCRPLPAAAALATARTVTRRQGRFRRADRDLRGALWQIRDGRCF